MKLLSDYFYVQNRLFAHFGYVEDWCSFPVADKTNCWWCLTDVESNLDPIGDGSTRITGGKVNYLEAKTLDEVNAIIDAGQYYQASIYTQRFLPKWVYPSNDGKHTMILIDTHTDGNKFLAVFDNSKILPTDKILYLMKNG